MEHSADTVAEVVRANANNGNLVVIKDPTALADRLSGLGIHRDPAPRMWYENHDGRVVIVVDGTTIRPDGGPAGPPPPAPLGQGAARGQEPEAPPPHAEVEAPRPPEAEPGMRGGGGGGGGGGDSGGPGGRAPEGPVDPARFGIPSGNQQVLQQFADQRGIVIRLRPTNLESLPHLEQGAMPKPEIVKAKTLNELDELIGGPVGQRGLVGFFEPTAPPLTLEPGLYDAARRRYEQRQQEYADQLPDYQSLESQGLLRMRDGMIEVVDPRLRGSATGEPTFRPVAGDLDVFDITHADGTPLTRAQRDAIIAELRFAGVNVEHGAHEWWPQQSPETFDPAIDAAIRAQHLTGQQLVAFAPGREPQGVWADSQVTGRAATEGGAEPEMPLMDLAPGEHGGDTVADAAAAAPPGQASFGELNPRLVVGGLLRHEAGGGHPLERHMFLDVADLHARLAAQPNLPEASTFTDMAVAHDAIGQTLEQSAGEIAAWLQAGAPGGPLRLHGDYSSPTGLWLIREAADPIAVLGVRVVLVADPGLPTGYRILTAFPEP